MSIVTWEDIYQYIKKERSVTIHQIFSRFDTNKSNVNRKLKSLRNHKKVEMVNGRIRVI